MNVAGVTLKRRVLVGAGLLAVAAGFWYIWTGSHPRSPGTVARGPEPFVKLAGAGQGSGDKVLEERAELLDPTPLFIPTARNYGQGPLPGRVMKQPGQVFGNFEAKLNFAPSGLANYGSGLETPPDSLPEMLASGNAAPLAGFGQVDNTPAALPERAGFIEVKALKDGDLRLRVPLTNLKLAAVDFNPAEFLILVGSAGLIGEPVLTLGSGRDEVDSAVRDFLVKTFRLGERLAPGRYVASVGP
ncbi:MAG: hypothetical protein HYV95_15490 [Opitutae bacterium]|nr:hypothetical protein [Opitutae bacterium]